MRRHAVELVTVLLIACGCWPAQAMAQGTRSDVPTLAEQRAFFKDQPKFLYGCDLILAGWIGKPREYDEQGMRMLTEMGASHLAINIGWVDVERTRGEFDFDYLDFLVDAAAQYKLEVMAMMTGTPDWALPAEGRGKKNVGHRYPPADEHEQAFVAFCKKVAQRYRGKIKYYHFWNEPNGCSWVNDGCANGDGYALYTRWLKIWYTALKSEDPELVLAAGNLDYHDGVTEGYKYLEGMYREGAKGYFDAIAIHPYDKKNTGAFNLRGIRDTRRVLVEHGDWDKGIWFTEYGWSTSDEALKARLLRRALGELNSPSLYYVTVACYLSLTDPQGEKGYGLCDKDLKPRPAYATFKAFTQARKKAIAKPVAPARSQSPGSTFGGPK